MTVVRRRGNVETIIQCNGNEVRWATKTHIPDDWLDANARKRALQRKALSDSKGGWQQIADNIPVDLLYQFLPQPETWQDWKYFTRFLNNPDHRKFRVDGDHRRA